MVDRKQAPRVYDAVDFDYALPPINEQKLDNGLPLYWLKAGVQDVVEIDWVFPAGLWYEEAEGMSQAVAALLKNGTSKRTAREINEALEYYGATLRVRPGNDNATLSLFTLTKHLPELLPIVFELLTDSVFPQSELDIYKQNTVQKLMVNLRQCDFVANQRIDAMLFSEAHPYGRFTRKDKIDALTQEGLQAFYKKAYQLSNAKIFMGGNITDKDVALINEVFGKVSVDTNENAKAEQTIQTQQERKEHVVNDENGVQGAIRIGRLFPNRHHADFAPMVVTNTIFGGYFGSRLMSNIREGKGYTYGIYSGMQAMQNGGTLTIQTEVGKDVVEKAVAEIYKELDIMCNDKVGEEELLLVKNYLLGGLLGDLDGPFQILQRWRTLILNGLPVAHFDKNINIYKTIGADEVLTMAQKYLDKGSFHEVVVI